MNQAVVADEGKISYNVVALHLDISCTNSASLKSDDNAASMKDEPLSMSSSHLVKRTSVCNMEGRTRSASTGRDKKADLRARYWAFLFENLQRAVDELYQTCETDENISECKEVILVLENYTREFHNLAEWFRVKWEYENTPPPQRPNSLAWEIRKSSPGKVSRRSCQPKLDSAVGRELIFELERASKNAAQLAAELPRNEKPSLNKTNVINERVCENDVSRYPAATEALRHPIDLEINLSKTPTFVDCGCQTESDCFSVKKTIPSGRTITSSTYEYSKRNTRSFTISTMSERNTLTSSLSSRRLSSCTSPIKPVPGRNVSAPIFIPEKRVNAQSKIVDSKTIAENSNKDKISRSQFNSNFETSNSALKSKQNEKSYANIENVKSVVTEDVNLKSPIIKTMQVIAEHKTVITDGDEEKKKEQAEAEIRDSINNKTINTDKRSEPKTPAQMNSCFDKPLPQRLVIEASEALPQVKNAINENMELVVKTTTASDNTTTATMITAPTTLSQLPTTVSTISIVTTGTTIPDSRVSAPASESSTMAVDNATLNSTGSKVDTAFADRKSAPSEMNSKLEVRKIPFKNSTVSHFSIRQRNPKAELSNLIKNKVVSTKAITSPRIANQNYVNNISVPKTFSDSKLERRKNCNVPLPLRSATAPCATSTSPASSLTSSFVSDSKSRKPVDAKKPLKYSPSVEANSKEYQATQRSNEQRQHPTIVRSKTSIDIKSKSNNVASELLPSNKISKEDRDLLPRSRRCSKDNDGWETVISRSRRSVPNFFNNKDKYKTFDVNKRFYEPSPSTSLPTLVITTGKEKTVDCMKLEKSKNRNRNNSRGSSSSVERNVHVQRDFIYKLNKERPIINSTTAFASVPSKRRKSNEKDSKKLNEKDSKKIKPKENKRKTSSESEKQINEDLLNEESLRKSKELYEKEISLQQEISDLQNTDPETDLDSDNTEIDPDIAELCHNKEYSVSERRALLELKYTNVLSKMTWAEQIEALDKLEELLERDPSGKSLKFVENFTSLKQFEDFMTRWPGRALELHQKLSSPSRKRISPDSTILQHKARQAKAKRNREQLLQDKSAKIKELFNKIAEVKAMQVTLMEERRKTLDQKLKKAEENRNLHLKNRQEKAHDEAKKQKEIAFINELEAQNKRHDFLALRQEQEDRIQSILEERQRRQEEKAAKEAAAEERRKAIEAERQEKIEELQEKIRKREERIDRELQEKERERIKMAREKARDREDRLMALQAAQIANAEELQKKIQQKQENSARRHEERIELIRQRAIEIGTPRLTPYQVNKLCSICNVLIDSEVFLLSHLRGSSHLEALKKYRELFEASVKFSECSIITDAPADILNEKKTREKERQKTLRKRCKKIRQRLSASSEKYMKRMNAEKGPMKKVDASNMRKILKLIKDVEKLFNAQGNGIWPNNAVTMLERSLFEIIRVLEKGNRQDQITFKEFDGFVILSKIYSLALDLPKNMSPYLPLKCFVVASNLYTSACNNNVENCLHVLLSNDIVQILDLLLNRLNLIMPNSDDRNGMVVYKADTVADVLMNLCSIILSNIIPLMSTSEKVFSGCSSIELTRHLQDVVSYTVCTGIVDKLAVYCSSVHDNKSADSYFLLHSIQLLTRLVETRQGNITDKEDCTSLMATLKATDLVGAVSMLYAILLHQDSMSSDTQSCMVELDTDVVNVIIATLQFFNRVCELNLEFFQNILGAEGISLQVRHIISYLLKYCVQNEGYKELLHKVIEFIGFFAIHHHDNQMILQSGSTPTVLQQLSNLPFAYFSNPSLVRVLFPTLLACCVGNAQNRMILDQEMSFQLLEDFKNSEKFKDIPLIKLLH